MTLHSNPNPTGLFHSCSIKKKWLYKMCFSQINTEYCFTFPILINKYSSIELPQIPQACAFKWPEIEAVFCWTAISAWWAISWCILFVFERLFLICHNANLFRTPTTFPVAQVLLRHIEMNLHLLELILKRTKGSSYYTYYCYYIISIHILHNIVHEIFCQK